VIINEDEANQVKKKTCMKQTKRSSFAKKFCGLRLQSAEDGNVIFSSLHQYN
jgi:hypothetical protein